MGIEWHSLSQKTVVGGKIWQERRALDQGSNSRSTRMDPGQGIGDLKKGE